MRYEAGFPATPEALVDYILGPQFQVVRRRPVTRSEAVETVREYVRRALLQEPAARPFVRGSDTSRDAALSTNANSGQRRVFECLKQHPATDEELAAALGLGQNTIRPRRRSLVQLGLVEDSGTRRDTKHGRRATVWAVVEGSDLPLFAGGGHG